MILNKIKFLLLLFLLKTMPVSANPQDITDDLLKKGVFVQVWSGGLHEGENVGHVALKTSQNYISFWNDNTNNKHGVFVKDIMEDIQNEERRNPDYTIFLKHPDSNSVNKIKENFIFLNKLLYEGKLRWDVVNNQPLKKALNQAYFKNQNNKFWSFSCASLILNILMVNSYIEINTQFNNHAHGTLLMPDRMKKLCAQQYLMNKYETNNLSELSERLMSRPKNRNLTHENLFLLGASRYESNRKSIFRLTNQQMYEKIDRIMQFYNSKHWSLKFTISLDHSGFISDVYSLLPVKDRGYLFDSYHDMRSNKRRRLA